MTGPLLPPLKPGDLLAGKYRIERIAGAGGMGTVLVAHHDGLDQTVAIKMLRSDLAVVPEAALRFQREAQTAAKLASEHVVRVFDVDATADGTPYLVMEYLEGQSLETIIDEHAPLPIRRAVDYALQALLGLAEAHAAGIVHRDLKPANLFAERRGDSERVKVLDFGISKLMDHAPTAEQLTDTDAFFGTPAYMSPEQVVSTKDVDGRADLWSMGVILFEGVTGRLPLVAEGPGALLAKILQAPLPRLREIRGDAPAGLERVVQRCLERDVDQRYQTAIELMHDLAPYASKGQSSSLLALADTRKLEPTGSAAPSSRAKTDLTWNRTSPTTSRRALTVTLVAAGALLVGLGGWWIGAGDATGAAGSHSAQPPRTDPVESAEPETNASADEGTAAGGGVAAMVESDADGGPPSDPPTLASSSPFGGPRSAPIRTGGPPESAGSSSPPGATTSTAAKDPLELDRRK